MLQFILFIYFGVGENFGALFLLWLNQIVLTDTATTSKLRTVLATNKMQGKRPCASFSVPCVKSIVVIVPFKDTYFICNEVVQR